MIEPCLQIIDLDSIIVEANSVKMLELKSDKVLVELSIVPFILPSSFRSTHELIHEEQLELNHEWHVRLVHVTRVI